jgi:MFS family permease
MVLHPLFGRLVNRMGARRLTMIGLVLVSCTLPLMSLTWSYRSAVAFYLVSGSAMALVITPSLAYMAEATSSAGIGSFGVGYGLYNMAWGAGLLGDPALAGFLFERFGFARLTLTWALALASSRAFCGNHNPGSPLKEPV